MRRTVAAVALGLLAIACEREPTAVEREPGLVVIAAPASVRNAPDHATIDGTELRLDAELWRDFMPVSPLEGKPLTALVWIYSKQTANRPLPPDADSCWVIHGDSAWVSLLATQPVTAPDSALARFSAHDGPLWPAGIRVDVTVRMVPMTGPPVYLRVADRTIARTD